MARRSRSRSSANAVGQRVRPYSGANHRLLSVRVSPVDLRVFEDRRLFPHREWPRRLVLPATKRSRRPVDAVPARISERVSGHFSFRAPRAVVVCVRRKQRREVLFAMKRTGRGAKAPRRLNEWSSVRC